MPPVRPRILQPTAGNLQRVAEMLRLGQLAGVPSETVYGLAANALSAEACAGIFRAKGRPITDPLIVHIADGARLGTVARPNAAALRLAEAFWPGPLTLVLPKRAHIPNIVTAGRKTVAVRVPAHPIFRQLIEIAGLPLAAPSANPFGYVSPTTAAHVRDGLAGTELRIVLDGGECTVGVESTIVDLTRPRAPRLLRPGGVAVERIESVLGMAVARPAARELTVSAETAAPAPGMLAQHYSPHTPLRLHERLDQTALAQLPPNHGAVLLRRPEGRRRAGDIAWFSEDGSLEAIARNLFSTLRLVDTRTLELVHVEIPPGSEGLAPAIRDRLTRAAARKH